LGCVLVVVSDLGVCMGQIWVAMSYCHGIHGLLS
jgi:hypothetical protein